MKALLAVLVSLCLTACAATHERPAAGYAKEAERVPVEVWTGGDDGLTQRLAEVVRQEFRTSAGFSLVDSGSAPRALRVIIPTHVEWRDVGSKTRLTYRLELERGGHRSKASSGNCWEAELATCARQVVEAAAASLNQLP